MCPFRDTVHVIISVMGFYFEITATESVEPSCDERVSSRLKVAEVLTELSGRGTEVRTSRDDVVEQKTSSEKV